MTPKDIVRKLFDSFDALDMATFASLFHEDAVIIVNGLHKYSRTYHGVNDWMQNMLGSLPIHFPNLKLTTQGMVEDQGKVFTLVSITADNLESTAVYHHTVENGKIMSFHLYDDSQKFAHAMKAM